MINEEIVLMIQWRNFLNENETRKYSEEKGF